MRRHAAAAVLAVVAFAGCSGIASAHAYVVTASPEMGASLHRTPALVSVTFDEPVTLPDASALRVRGPDGDVACAGGAQIDPDNVTRVICRPEAPLRRGAYEVRWRVVSADTHVVHGEYGFGVGTAARAVTAERAEPWDPSGPLASLARWFAILGALVLAGAAYMRVRFAQEDTVAAGAERIQAAALAVCAFGTAADLVLQCAAVAGTFAGVLHARTLLDVFGSSWGYAWIARALLLGAIARASAAPPRAILAWVVLVTFSFSGHALDFAGAARAGAIAVDVLHFSGAALWIGGLLTLTATLPSSLRLVARFSQLALPGAALVLASGVVAAVLHLTKLADLTGTFYGRLLLLKLVLFAVLIGLGAYGFRYGRGQGSGRGARRAIVLEAATAILVLAATAVLTGTPPPMRMAAASMPQTAMQERPPVKLAPFVLTLATAAAATAAPISAHVRVFADNGSSVVTACGYTKFIVRVPVEKPIATTRIDLIIPAAMHVIDVQPKEGWHAHLTFSKGSVVRITWDGGHLLPHEFDEFAFLAAAPRQPQTVSWDAIQTYADGSQVKWTGAPGTDTPHSQTRITGACPRR